MKEIMTIKEFSEATGLKVWVVRRLVKEKKLVFFMSGRVAYINYPKSMESLWKEPREANLTQITR